MNCKRYFIICHSTSNLLRNCTFNCTTFHDSYSIQKSDKSLIYSNYLQKCHVLMFWVTRLCITACQHVFKISAVSRHTLMLCVLHATFSIQCQWRVVATLCQASASSRRSHNLLHWHDVKWRHWHSEKTIKLNKSIKQKYFLLSPPSERSEWRR